MKELADGCELEEVPSGYRLSWPGAEATFYRRYDAVTFSWVVDADPATIDASYRHINGEPLFDLGIRATETELFERPRGRALEPPPIEVSPLDDEEVDYATIDAVLADFDWERRKPSEADEPSLFGSPSSSMNLWYTPPTETRWAPSQRRQPPGDS